MKRVTQLDRKSKCATGASNRQKKALPTRLTAAQVAELDSRVALIQALIPVGLQAVEELLQAEVTQLAGARYQRSAAKAGVRWGRQRGSVYLAEQKLPVQVPRVRNRQAQQELALQSYQRLQQPQAADEGLLRKVVVGLSQRRYAECAALTPEVFGLSPANVSRRYVQASERHLQQLCERRLEDYDIVAIFLDGKSFAGEEMLLALGITLAGEKVILGFAQTTTENARACSDFLRDLLRRGLKGDAGLLCILDGSKGLHAAVRKVFGEKALVQRCQWHKRENVVSYLAPSQQRQFRAKLQRAYAAPSYAEAKAALEQVRQELRPLNESAARSLAEGLEETLTLHRLGLVEELGSSFKTTNCLESVNAQVEQRTRRVCRWRNSNQMQRWLACALWDLEPRLHKVKGYRYLSQLRRALQRELGLVESQEAWAA